MRTVSSEEMVAEFTYQPGKCEKTYRMVVVRKELEIGKGQKRLFEEPLFLLHHQRGR